MFKGFDSEKSPPYQQIIYYVVGEKVYKTTYYVSKGYADSISISSSSEVVDIIPIDAIVEVAKWKTLPVAALN